MRKLEIQKWTVGQFCVFSLAAVLLGWFGVFAITDGDFDGQLVGLAAILAAACWFRIAWIWFERRD